MATGNPPPKPPPTFHHPFRLRGMALAAGGIWLLLVGVGLSSYCIGQSKAVCANSAATALGPYLVILAFIPMIAGIALTVRRSSLVPTGPQVSTSLRYRRWAREAVFPTLGILLVTAGIWVSWNCPLTPSGDCQQTAYAPFGAVVASSGVILAALGVVIATGAVVTRAVREGSPERNLGRRRGRWFRLVRHAAAGSAGVALGVALVLSVVVFPWVFGPAQIDKTMEFVDYDWVAVTTVWGDVHVNMTGSWTASAPSWQWWGYSGLNNEPACYPRCGNGSTGGVIGFSEDFCVQWPGGGTNYYWGTTMTIYIAFAAPPNASDTVRLAMTLVVTHSTVCA